jgi:hypothetical protein
MVYNYSTFLVERTMKNDAPLTKREIKKAARLFVLISMAFGIGNDGSAGNTDCEAMIEEVVDSARNALLKEFPSLLESMPTTQSKCVAAIKGMRN